MSATEDSMSSDESTVGQQQPPERPAPSNDENDAERNAATEPLSGITTEPGPRYTDDVQMLVVEAELVCLDGKQLDNPAKIPEHADGTAEQFAEDLENHEEDLVPAWTRPWEAYE
jgi:hypothetical protein